VRNANNNISDYLLNWVNQNIQACTEEENSFVFNPKKRTITYIPLRLMRSHTLVRNIIRHYRKQPVRAF
jgi:hypothetical protein